jgi:hypothetical protein
LSSAIPPSRRGGTSENANREKPANRGDEGHEVSILIVIGVAVGRYRGVGKRNEPEDFCTSGWRPRARLVLRSARTPINSNGRLFKIPATEHH